MGRGHSGRKMRVLASTLAQSRVARGVGWASAVGLSGAAGPTIAARRDVLSLRVCDMNRSMYKLG